MEESLPAGDRGPLRKRAAEIGAVDRENAAINSDLAIAIDAWDSLPPGTRTAILAIVDAAQGR